MPGNLSHHRFCLPTASIPSIEITGRATIRADVTPPDLPEKPQLGVPGIAPGIDLFQQMSK